MNFLLLNTVELHKIVLNILILKKDINNYTKVSINNCTKYIVNKCLK